MNNTVILPTSFPVTLLPDKQDVVTLAQNKDWIALNNVIICQDSDSKVTARFGQNTWNISPYIAGSKANAKPIFDFSAYTNAPLLLELKLIVYGWLFHKSGKMNKPAKIGTLTSRFFSLKKIYRFLLKNDFNSLSALANKTIWSKFEAELINKQYAQGTIERYFVAINTALILQSWLKVDFGFTAINARYLSKKLSNKTEQQTLVIPERLSDAIYGKAIELVEQGDLYHQKLIAVMDEIQANYCASKKIVDHKIQSKKWKYLTDQHGQITSSRNYYREIQKRLPMSIKGIIKRHLDNIDELSHIYDGNDFQRYYGQLITACYICCGAFSGMRDSELAELTPQSYFRETFEGREFHMLQSRTFKFGEKDETWVAAPIAEKAISLATKLTQQWREILQNENLNYRNTLWLNQQKRFKTPVVIQGWNKRLKRFCEQFDFKVTTADHQECIEYNPNSVAKIEQFIKVGQPWHFTTHQFRRSLAFYTIRHRLGTTLSLKQQFKHLYLTMTEWYTNGGQLARIKSLKIDSELQTQLNNAKDENTANKIFNMVHSDKILSGSHGKAIVKMRDNIPHIYSSWDVIYAAVKQKTLTLHGTGHSYCKSGYDCDMDGIVNPAFCVDCSQGSSIIDEECAKWWQTKHSALTTYLANQTDVSPTEYSHCITQIRAAETVMKDFNMPFIEYQHPIEVVQL